MPSPRPWCRASPAAPPWPSRGTRYDAGGPGTTRRDAARTAMPEPVTPGAKRFVAPDEVETMVFAWGTIKWLSETRVTGSGIAAGVVILEPGKGHTRHNHPGSEE